MAEITIINVGGDNIGITGLDQAMAEIKAEFASRPDHEVASLLLARLGKRNYMPPELRDQYAKAFVREFRRRLGGLNDPGARRAPEGMNPMQGCSCMKK